jgi:hypothetical protein
VFSPAVEVTPDICDGYDVGIIDGDLFGSGQNEVFGNFDAQLDKEGDTPVIPWMKTLRAMSFPCASCP